jgi:crossover junction endodeoxyribonuclease RusA
MGEPVAKERPRMGKGGNFYTPKATKEYEDLVAWCVAGKRTFDGHVKVTVCFCTKKTKADGDNFLKSLLDGLQKGGSFRNDNQVVDVHYKVHYGCDTPKTVFVIEDAQDVTCHTNPSLTQAQTRSERRW